MIIDRHLAHIILNDCSCFRSLDSIVSLIERPEIYIFARSNSSTKDQMLYTPYRVEDLKSLLPSVSHSEIVYHSKMRVGIGTFQLHAFEITPCSREEIEAVEVYISINIMIAGSNNNCVTSHHRMLALAFHNIIVANILK